MIERQIRWLATNPAHILQMLERLEIRHVALKDWLLRQDMNGLSYVRIRSNDHNPRKPVVTAKRVTEPGIREIAEAQLIGPDFLEALGRPTLEKDRYGLGNDIHVDVYRRPAGIVTIEWVNPPEDASADKLPAWTAGGGLVEVTDSLSVAHLAALPDLEHPRHNLEAVRANVASRVPMIVLTGGPCSGKSALLDLLRADSRFLVIPETATLIMAQLGIRPSGDPAKDERFQLTLRETQIAWEALARAEATERGCDAVILDRGLLDSGAYIPGGPSRYLHYFGTHPDRDAQRYHGVIQLAVPSLEIYEQNRANNPHRREGHTAALVLGHAIRKAWEPNARHYAYVEAATWEDKVRDTCAALTKMLSA